MASCTKCGQNMPSEAAYCSRCGAEMASDWSSANRAPDTRHNEPDRVQRSNTQLVVVLGILVSLLLVIIVVCGGGLYLFLAAAPSGARSAATPTKAPTSAGPALAPLPPLVTPGVTPGTAPAPQNPEAAVTPPVPDADQPLVYEAPAPEPDDVADRKIHLTVQAETWRQDKEPFDIKKALLEQFKHDGIAVVDDQAAAVDATISVTYYETKGARYTFNLGGPDPDGDEPDNPPGGAADSMRGTRIHYTLTILGPTKDTPRLTIDQETDLGTFVQLAPGKSLYETALIQFQNYPGPFSLSGSLVGTALGRAKSATRVKPDLLDVDRAMLVQQALTAGGFKPVTAEDRVYWALANGEFDDAAKEKAVAVPLLIEYINHRDIVMTQDDRCAAVEALGTIGGAAAGKFVGDAIAARAPNRPDAYYADEAPAEDDLMLVELIRAAAEMKLRSVDAALIKLCNDPNDKVATAAQRAVKSFGLPVPKILPKKVKPPPPDDPPEVEPAP